ncbi:hypothetical protein ACS0TY_015096 [Phlomoides rotata]
MGRAPCCDKANVKKGPWSPEEDAQLKEYIEKHGTVGNWISLPNKAGLRRCGKSCRLRWLNYLRPNIKHGEFSDDEDRIICSLFARIGSRWSIIAGQLPGRTDNDIKNYWNTKLKKKLMGMPQKFPLQPTISQVPYNYNNNPFLQSPLISSSYSQPTLPSLISSVYELCENNIISSGFTPTSLLQHGTNYNHVKDGNNNLLVFGGEATSCSKDYQFTHGKKLENDHGFGSNAFDEENQKFFIGTNDGYEKGADGNFSENPLDNYSMDDIKQLISTNHICNNVNFFMDHEIKKEERTLY